VSICLGLQPIPAFQGQVVRPKGEPEIEKTLSALSMRSSALSGPNLKIPSRGTLLRRVLKLV
jgi:hypothetical protein